MPKIFLLFSLVLLQSYLVSCEKINPKNKKSSSSKSSHILDLEKQGNIDRIANREKALVSFYTKSAAFCEVWYYALDPKEKPKKADSIKTPCGNQKAIKDFAVTLTGLNPKTIYRFEIHAWPDGSKLGVH